MSELAEAIGKSEKTVYRYISKGRITKEEGENGLTVFDPSEVARAFPEVKFNEKGEILKSESKSKPEKRENGGEIELLNRDIDHLREQLATERERRQEAERREREARADAVELREMLKAEQQNIRLLAPPVPASETQTKKASGKRSMGQRLAAWWDGVG